MILQRLVELAEVDRQDIYVVDGRHDPQPADLRQKDEMAQRMLSQLRMWGEKHFRFEGCTDYGFIISQWQAMVGMAQLQEGDAAAVQLLGHMGVHTETHGERGGISLRAPNGLRPEAPYDLVKSMRASVLVLATLRDRWVTGTAT